MKTRSAFSRFSGPHIVQPVVRTKASPISLINTSIESESIIESLKLDAAENNTIIKKYLPIKTPSSELSDSKPFLHSISSISLDVDKLLIFEVHPLLSEVPREEIKDHFVKKCQQCCQMCDFSKSDQSVPQKAKEEILTDILRGASDIDLVSRMNEDEYLLFYRFFSKNVIRSTPQPPDLWSSPSSLDFLTDRVVELSWDHISLCYDIFLAFISNRRFNYSFCKKSVFKIIHGIIPLFTSPDAREREKLINVFHGMYRHLIKYRHKMLKEISNLFFISKDSSTPIGCAELLNSLIPIVQGYKVPLHKDNVTFFTKIILPLHSCPQFQYFSTNIIFILFAFISKDSSLIVLVFDYLLRHWPKTSPTKQILFLNEIEKLSEAVSQENVVMSATMISKMLSFCVTEMNFGVCEKALMLWESDPFMKLIAVQSRSTYPILVPAIFNAATTHWCEEVKTLALNSMRLLKGCDLAAFDAVGQKFHQTESEKANKQIEAGNIWLQMVENYAAPSAKDWLYKIINSIYTSCEPIHTVAQNSSNNKNKSKNNNNRSKNNNNSSNNNNNNKNNNTSNKITNMNDIDNNNDVINNTKSCTSINHKSLLEKQGDVSLGNSLLTPKSRKLTKMPNSTQNIKIMTLPGKPQLSPITKLKSRASIGDTAPEC
ncbi:phosphoprotein phosphatase [Tritrichomonas foetus]|uniref:Phosphoprotein phosphatase n=1 Tax=Tritrichomonas foetus TaxID=1144522 RepID=A0A1J4JHR0_9EUKA|nr:phosphoprotein phosphatase [Tritrichomonas foetus]|eukprot:OHS97791.1 phosphoprotein phosphatase [Tritrichomonas foetus]